MFCQRALRRQPLATPRFRRGRSAHSSSSMITSSQECSALCSRQIAPSKHGSSTAKGSSPASLARNTGGLRCESMRGQIGDRRKSSSWRVIAGLRSNGWWLHSTRTVAPVRLIVASPFQVACTAPGCRWAGFRRTGLPPRSCCGPSSSMAWNCPRGCSRPSSGCAPNDIPAWRR